ncbi:MAG: hypothetical protein IID45_09345 [Planctomycetes bacterium]|nr:hypothetical protein [Planctomycetota bacterium]
MSQSQQTSDSGQPLWQQGLRAAWTTGSVAEGTLDEEQLAAYVDGTLTEAERGEVEELLSQNPEALSLVADLQKSKTLDQPEKKAATTPPPTGVTVPARSFRTWIALAASVLVTAGALMWGINQNRRTGKYREEMQAQKGRLADSQLQLAVLYKERFLSRANTNVRNYWNGTVTPAMLELPLARGPVNVPPDAQAEADRAEEALKVVRTIPSHRSRGLLESASIDIAAGRFDAAKEKIDEAAELSGKTPEVASARALLLIARGDAKSVTEAQRQLETLTREHPDYLPGWYNLAMLLEQIFQDEKSRHAWDEYLKREQREPFRKIARVHRNGLKK